MAATSGGITARIVAGDDTSSRPRGRKSKGDRSHPLITPSSPQVVHRHSVDTAGERLVFRARTIKEGIVLFGNEDDLDELIGFVAAEANHEEDRRRQKRLDLAFRLLNSVLQQAR